MAVRLGDTAPDFTAATTQGEVRFHTWKGNSRELRNIIERVVLFVDDTVLNTLLKKS